MVGTGGGMVLGWIGDVISVGHQGWGGVIGGMRRRSCRCGLAMLACCRDFSEGRYKCLVGDRS